MILGIILINIYFANLFSDLLFLTALTSSVFVISEIKKFVERQLQKRQVNGQYNKFEMDFV